MGDDDQLLFWLKNRDSPMGDGRQVVSEQLLDRAHDEIERLRAALSEARELADMRRWPLVQSVLRRET